MERSWIGEVEVLCMCVLILFFNWGVCFYMCDVMLELWDMRYGIGFGIVMYCIGLEGKLIFIFNGYLYLFVSLLLLIN